MKRIFALLAAILLLAGCAGQSAPTQGLKITVECSDVYSISCSTGYETSVGSNADNSPFEVGDHLYFNVSEGKTHYTISICNIAGRTLASADFTDDFGLGMVELTVTDDYRIIRSS